MVQYSSWVRRVLQVAFGFLAGGVMGFALLFFSFVIASESPSVQTADLVVLGTATLGSLVVVIRIWREHLRLRVRPRTRTARTARRGLSRRETAVLTLSMWLGRRPARESTGSGSS